METCLVEGVGRSEMVSGAASCDGAGGGFVAEVCEGEDIFSEGDGTEGGMLEDVFTGGGGGACVDGGENDWGLVHVTMRYRLVGLVYRHDCSHYREMRDLLPIPPTHLDP